MIASLAVLLTLAGAPAQDPHAAQTAAAPVERVEQNRVSAAQQRAARQPGIGAPAHAEEKEGKIDFLHHIQDSHEWETPFGVVDFRRAGTWKVAGIDMSPTKHVFFLALAGLLTIVFIGGGVLQAGRAQAGRVGGTRHNVIEALVLFVRNEVVMPNVGHGGEKYAPFVCTIFFFILFCNLLGLIPFGSTATANIAVTAALAFITFVVAEIGGLIAQGPRHYLGTLFFVPKGMHPAAGITMAILLFPIELIGKFTRPFALAIRLMANMTAGHIVMLAIISLIFVFGSYAIAVGPVLMAVAITFLELFVSFLQAFIFAILTSVFIGLVRHAH